MRIKNLLLSNIIILAAFPAVVSASEYATSISPSGTSISGPITATFNIQDFSLRDYDLDTPTSCYTGLTEAAKAEMRMEFNYWINDSEHLPIPPILTPTSAMIESGIYTATFNLEPGQIVYSIGLEFITGDGTGIRYCGFSGNQPNGVPGDWGSPLFTVVAPPPTVVTVPVLPQNNAPRVSAKFPVDTMWFGKKDILYSAIDTDRAPYGLKDFPINVYLSNDGGSIWKELIRNESNKGEYSIDTNNFPDGTNYKVKIVALDNENKAGEAISNTFGIDNTKPSFAVEIGSEVIKEKDRMNLKIISSEHLIETPRVLIAQSGADVQPLSVSGSGREFTASYTVLKGHVGTAVVSIVGKDTAGNSGEKITSGETFVVSYLGPPPPTIKNIVNNESFSDPKIDIFGSAPSAREVIFSFNKEDKRVIKPLESGDFSFTGIVLSASNFGENTLKFSSIDTEGLQSEEKLVTVKLNSPPKISWVARPAGAVSGNIKLEWETQDANDDKLVYSLFYSSNNGRTWDAFSKGFLGNSYELDTATFFDGTDYLIKVVVDDGTTTSEIVSDKMTFRNNITIAFKNTPKNYLFSTTKPEFTGELKLPGNKIVTMRFSLEKDLWITATARDGKFDSLSEIFSIQFPEPLIDGGHTLFIETEDDAGNTYRTFQPFIIDTLPPKKPVITYPLPDTTILSKMDIEEKIGGIQIDVSGEAEAGAEIELFINNRAYKTRTTSQGAFLFKAVTFLSRGVNRYFISVTDVADNVSKIDGFFMSNNVPELSLLEPVDGDFWSGTRQIKWRASDKDGDPLVFQVLYRKENKDWISATQNISESEFSLNASDLKEGAYELKVLANDGLTEVSSALHTIIIDNSVPKINFDSGGPLNLSKRNLLFSGSATDNLSGVKYIEYSLDGATWFKGIIANGYLQKKASFVIRHPFELDDGEYRFGVRAIDAAGNISKPAFEKIVVDSTPPRVGSFMLSYGEIPIFPEGDAFIVPTSLSLRMKISLERDTQNASVFFGGQKTDFLKNKSTGLWEADVEASTVGISNILITAEDALGNVTSNTSVGNISVVSSGETIAGAKITILTKNEEARSFSMWPAWSYGLGNPIFADTNGKYSLVLPAGTYQFLIEKTGYQRLKISDVTVLNTKLINFNFELKPREGIRGKIEDFMEHFIFKRN